jgi:phage tail-like protein
MSAVPIIVNNFHLDISGVKMFPLVAVSGIGRQIEPATQMSLTSEGKPLQTVVPSRKSQLGQLQCSGFVQPNDEVSKWFFRIQGGKADQKDATLTLFDYETNPVEKWTFQGLWPSELSFGHLDAGGDETPVGNVTFQFESIERA